jgi:hypothetical protein
MIRRGAGGVLGERRWRWARWRKAVVVGVVGETGSEEGLMRRTILRHAFVILTVAFLLGLAAGVAGGSRHPHARLWLASHVTALLVAVMIAVIGLAWSELELGERARKVLYFVTVPMNYYALVVLGVLAPALGVPQAIAAPGLPPAPSWMQGLMGFSLIVVTASSLLMSSLLVFGLRGPVAGAKI